MRYVAAYLLAVLGGNATPDLKSISTILGSVGIECDKAKAEKVINSCKGKDIEQIIAEGTKKLSSLPTGGGAAVAGGSAGAPAAGGAADAKKGAAKEEPKKEEKKKADSDDEGDDMGFGLFD